MWNVNIPTTNDKRRTTTTTDEVGSVKLTWDFVSCELKKKRTEKSVFDSRMYHNILIVRLDFAKEYRECSNQIVRSPYGSIVLFLIVFRLSSDMMKQELIRKDALHFSVCLVHVFTNIGFTGGQSSGIGLR